MEGVCWMDGLKRRDEALEVSDVSRPEHLTTHLTLSWLWTRGA